MGKLPVENCWSLERFPMIDLDTASEGNASSRQILNEEFRIARNYERVEVFCIGDDSVNDVLGAHYLKRRRG